MARSKILEMQGRTQEHPSVMKISENNTINNELNFKHVSEEFVTKQVNKLNVKKATGHDGISPKILTSKIRSEG
jgi:hypothetical protein